ncbi:MAG: hypothetical protein EHM12_10225 [Dehalococcoidia bacterium]|nr:MAG: hypothetical protein EHM12_10225 [Dehalococcoidia bacterium]
MFSEFVYTCIKDKLFFHMETSQCFNSKMGYKVEDKDSDLYLTIHGTFVLCLYDYVWHYGEWCKKDPEFRILSKEEANKWLLDNHYEKYIDMKIV